MRKKRDESLASEPLWVCSCPLSIYFQHGKRLRRLMANNLCFLRSPPPLPLSCIERESTSYIHQRNNSHLIVYDTRWFYYFAHTHVRNSVRPRTLGSLVSIRICKSIESIVFQHEEEEEETTIDGARDSLSFFVFSFAIFPLQTAGGHYNKSSAAQSRWSASKSDVAWSQNSLMLELQLRFR